MALFFGVSPGEERKAPGIRLTIPTDGETAWFHGKWLDIGDEHGVIWPDGKSLRLGQFPAWVIYGSGRNAPHAAMFSVSQFRGGRIEIKSGRSRNEYPVPRGDAA